MGRGPREAIRQFVAGRYCLRVGLEPLAPRFPILVLDSGAPALPHGLSGSISHKGTIAVAIASADFEGIGIDLERVDERDGVLERKVLTEIERVALPSLGSLRTSFVTTHFSLKEAVYKASPSDDQEDMEFRDIALRLPHLALMRQLAWFRIPIEVTNSRFHYDGYVYRHERLTLAIATRLRRQALRRS